MLSNTSVLWAAVVLNKLQTLEGPSSIGMFVQKRKHFQRGSTRNYQNISLELQQKKNHYCFLSCSQKQRTALVVQSFFWMFRGSGHFLVFQLPLFLKRHLCFKIYSSFLLKGLSWPSMTTMPSVLERRKRFSSWHVNEEQLKFSLWGADRWK